PDWYDPLPIEAVIVSRHAHTVLGGRSVPTFRSQQFLAVGTKRSEGVEVSIVQDGAVVASEVLTSNGEYAKAVLEVPLSKGNGDEFEFSVYSQGQLVNRIRSRHIQEKRAAEIQKADAHIHSVFQGNQLPQFEFEKPGWIELLLGEYSMSTTYYNSDYELVSMADKPGRYGAVTELKGEGLQPVYRYTTLFRVDAEQPVDWSSLAITKFNLPDGLGIDPDVAKRQASTIGKMIKEELENDFVHKPFGATLLAALRESSDSYEEMHRRNEPWARNDAWWLKLKKKLGHFRHRYHVSLPEGYDDPANVEMRWPLILFLHGSGERGYDPNPLPTNGPVRSKTNLEVFPFIVISPQCEPGTWWKSSFVEDLLIEVEGLYRVDSDRIYLTGLSMGGYGSWFTAQAYPNRFAAVAPICGGGDPDDAGRLVNVPIWAFHGDEDRAVPIERSTQMIEAIRKKGGKYGVLTTYPGVGHDSWNITYQNPDLYKWFLANKRGHPIVMPVLEEIAP
ncbi:MAG: dienelactone hydrolase family protein, partial [Verrucomicrobiota bacterium]